VQDEVSLGEITRKIEDFRRDVRDDFAQISQQLTQFVLREVYLSDERTRTTRFEAIEAELKRSSANRVLMATLAITAFLGPVVVGIIVFLVTRGLK
jgi:hypothetical protein